MNDLHISLLATALAALITIWLGARCGKVRMAEKILHGDGGNARLQRRMRAQSNFIEYAPIALLLILGAYLAVRWLFRPLALRDALAGPPPERLTSHP